VSFMTVLRGPPSQYASRGARSICGEAVKW
jgi:hypothetical protein